MRHSDAICGLGVALGRNCMDDITTDVDAE